MSKVSITSLMIICAALAACSDSSTNRAVTAPEMGALLNETADLGGSYTIDGSSDDAFGTQDVFAGMAGAQTLGVQLAASAQTGSDSRATGHVGFPLGTLPTNIPILNEKYSFTALSTDPSTLAAKGHFEAHFTQVPGGDIQMQGDVNCMITFSGNTARVSAQITKLWRNGVPSPITANTHAFWVVVDNGEGGTTPDLVSLVRFSNATIAQRYCSTGFLSFVFPNQEGNVQVSQ